MKLHKRLVVGFSVFIFSFGVVFAISDDLLITLAENSLQKSIQGYFKSEEVLRVAVENKTLAIANARNSCDVLKGLKRKFNLEIKDESCGLPF